MQIALSRVFISFEVFRLTLIKKDRQNILYYAYTILWLYTNIMLMQCAEKGEFLLNILQKSDCKKGLM